jgi:alkane 1-monooxygenase
MLQFLLLQATYCAGIALLGGGLGLAAFVAQAIIAVFILESVAYVEHYGLVRGQEATGRFSAIAAEHSWDSYSRFSSYLEFNLQRHADHHAVPHKPYAQLRPHERAPRLPAGYPVMIFTALVPPLWFKVMDSRLQRLAGR